MSSCSQLVLSFYTGSTNVQSSNEAMSFSRMLVLLIVLTLRFWGYGKSCERQKYAKEKTEDHYEKLLDTETGYTHEHLKYNYDEQKKSLSWTVKTATDDFYGKLLCSYVFNCSHYINLIRPLLTAKGKIALKELIIDQTNSVFSFQDKVIDMLNVLYNFGKIDSLDALWLVYMYSISSDSLDINSILNEEDRRIRLLNEHDTVSSRLAKFTEIHCNGEENHNVYNDQLVGSDYFNSLIEIYANPVISYEIIKDSVDKFKITIDERINTITDSMNIVDCKSYFAPLHLRLKADMCMNWLLAISVLLHDFAEIVDDSEPLRTAGLIDNICAENSNIESFQMLTNEITKCQNIFINLLKYILLYTSWKHVLGISICLVKKYKKWWMLGSAITKIKMYNSVIYEDFNQIVRYLNLEQDEELKFIAELFQSPSSAKRMANVETIKEVENEILAILKNFNPVNFIFSESYFSAAKFNKKYFKRRFKNLYSLKAKICGRKKIKLCKLESRLSFYIFNKYVKYVFNSIDFEVIGSFKRFSENM